MNRENLYLEETYEFGDNVQEELHIEEYVNFGLVGGITGI